MCFYCIYTVHQYKKNNLQGVGLEMLSSADYQLDRLRGQGMVTEYNPNYDFGGTKCTLQDLREVPRDHLTLIRYVYLCLKVRSLTPPSLVNIINILSLCGVLYECL